MPFSSQTRVPSSGRVPTLNIFSPASVTSVSLKAWYRADQGVTIGTGVSQWNDLSGNGYHLTQGTGTNQPTLEPTGFNGQPSILFDGSNDSLSQAGTLATTVFGGTRTPQTIYMVFEVISLPAAAGYILSAGNSGNTSIYHVMGITPSSVFTVLRDDGVVGQKSANLNLAIANKFIYRQFFAGSANSIIMNVSNKNLNVSMDTGNLNVNTFTVGAWDRAGSVTSFVNVRIAEIIIYNGQPTTTEDFLLGEYLYNRYKIFNTSAPTNINSATLKSWYRADQGLNNINTVSAVNSPLDITGCTGWFDFNDTSNMSLTGSTINSIKNKATNLSWNGTNATLTTVGGLNFCTLAGTGYVESTTDTTTINSFINNQANTVFFVGSRTGGNTIPGFVCATAPGSARPYKLYFQNVAGISYETIDNSGGADQIINTNTYTANTAVNLYEWTDSGANVSIYANGRLQSTTSASYTGGTKTITSVQLGANKRNITGNFLTGTINEVIIYNKVLSATELGQVRRYLANKWGIIIDAISKWSDLSGNSYHMSQSLTYQYPQLNTIDSTFNNQSSVTFDNIQQFMNLGAQMPVGAPMYVIAVLKQNTWAGSSFFFSDNTGNAGVIYQNSGSVSPNITMYNGVVANTNSGLPIGQVKRVSVNFSNSTSDYIKARGITVTGTSAGGNTTNTYRMNGGNGVSYANFSLAELIIYNSLPNNSDLALLDAYLSNRYGISILS